MFLFVPLNSIFSSNSSRHRTFPSSLIVLLLSKLDCKFQIIMVLSYEPVAKECLLCNSVAQSIFSSWAWIVFIHLKSISFIIPISTSVIFSIKFLFWRSSIWLLFNFFKFSSVNISNALSLEWILLLKFLFFSLKFFLISILLLFLLLKVFTWKTLFELALLIESKVLTLENLSKLASQIT